MTVPEIPEGLQCKSAGAYPSAQTQRCHHKTGREEGQSKSFTTNSLPLGSRTLRCSLTCRVNSL